MGTIVVNGTEYESMEEAVKVFKMPLTLVEHRLELGWDLDRAITYCEAPEPFKKKKHDLTIDGTKYQRMSTLGDVYGINGRVIMERLFMGESLESIIDNPKKEYVLVIEGIEYATIREAANVYGHEPHAFYGKALSGADLLYLLYEKVKKEKDTVKNGKEVLYEGVVYPSLLSLCEKYNVPYTQVSFRLRKGESLNRVIKYYILKREKKNSKFSQVDYISQDEEISSSINYGGNVYNNMDDLVDTLGINKFALASLVRVGFDLDYAIKVELAFKKE